MQENTDQKITEYGHFSRIVIYRGYLVLLINYTYTQHNHADYSDTNYLFQVLVFLAKNYDSWYNTKGITQD